MPFMPTRRRLVASLATALAALAPSLAAHAAPGDLHTRPEGSVTLVDTPGPGGLLGTNGFDVFRDQSVAARFTVPAGGPAMRFLRASVWLMNNSEDLRGKLTVTLQADARDEGGPDSVPGQRVLETWETRVKTFGWTPVEQSVVTHAAAKLEPGRSYWLVLQSASPPLVDPVWTFARKGSMVTTTSFGGAWQPTSTPGAALTLRVDALPMR